MLSYLRKNISNLIATPFLKNSVTQKHISPPSPWRYNTFYGQANTHIFKTSANDVSRSTSVTKLKFTVTRWVSAIFLCLFVAWGFFYPIISSDTAVIVVRKFREHKQNLNIKRHKGFIPIYLECLCYLETGKVREVCKGEPSTPVYILPRGTQCSWITIP